MSGGEYAVLVNDTLKRQLDLLERSELARVREKLEFLASGLWDGGLRVKKLKGKSGSVVFEARMSKGDRLLFTLGREGGKSIVYAWGIESHDEVDRAKRSVLPENAPFLGFEPLSVEERPDLIMDDLAPEYYSQGAFDAVESAEVGPQRWRILDDFDWRRLLASSDRRKTDLRLFLTEEQRGVLEQPPPLFLSGTAGSGKTTIAVYYLFRPLPSGSRRLFVTNHPYLCAYSERLYDGLAAEAESLPGQLRPRFAPYRDIVREIVANGSGQGSDGFDPACEVDFIVFERMLQGRKEFSSLDPELAWEEIRGIIKGAKSADPGKPLLSFSDYQALGKKRAPRFNSDRAGIYAAAEWYQSRLTKDGLWDEVDLTRRAIDILEGRPHARVAFEPWDLIVCDEAQDFTNIHVSLLFRLVSDPGNVVMAGDVKQIVNPSGFRWADLRALFWERGLRPPGLFSLSLNFRSVGGIVALGNALLDLKKRLAGIQSDEKKETWKFRGKSPCLLVANDVSDASVAEELSGAGASSAIIVRDIETRESVKAIARSDLVFTVVEAKGLEFDSALLWKLTPVMGDIAALWRRLAGDDSLAKEYEARIVHEINLYYVAVTRARNALVVYEENLDFWNQAEFADLYIRSEDPGLLGDSWRAVSTPEEWREQAEYYYEREYWKAAAECYKNAGDEAREGLARGLGLYAERRFAEAAGFLEKAVGLPGSAGLDRKAATAYEESGDYRKASALWESSGDGERSRVCLARALEKERDFGAAAAVWLELGDRDAALRDLERSGDRAAVGEICREMRLWEKAAKAFGECGRHAEAAECWRKVRDREKAAEAYRAAGEWEKAVRYFILARQYEKIPDCWLKAGRYDKAAASFIDRREPEKAVAAMRKWIETEPAAVATLREEAAAWEKKKPLHAAVRLAALGERGSAARLFMGQGEYDLALAGFMAEGDHANASICLERQKNYHGAAIEQELVSPDSPRVVDLLERYIMKGEFYGDVDRRLAEKLNEEGRIFEAEGEPKPAANRFMAIGNIEAAYRCLLELDRDDRAFDFFLKYRALEELGTFMRKKKNFYLNHKAVMHQASALTETRFGPYYLVEWPYLLEALGRCRGETDARNPEFREELAALLPMEDLGAYKVLADPKHVEILDFLIRIGHINGLLLIWRNAVRKMGESNAYFREFVGRIETAAAKGPSAAWFKAFLELIKGHEEAALIGPDGLEHRNSLLYAIKVGHSSDLFAWYLEHGTEDEFTAFGKYLRLEDEIAEYLDAHDRRDLAAIWYERARRWDEALRCYRAARDEAGSARMLEKSGVLDEALTLWKRIGSARDVKRVEKAIAAGKSGKARPGRARAGAPRRIDDGQLDLLP